MNSRAVVTEYAWSTQGCDPCPTPPLDGGDLATLGADVLASRTVGRGGMTVTRMHTRYNAQSLSEDLVFREVGAVVGGREQTVDGQTRALEQGAQPAPFGTNNFQARYAIRHPWTGPIRCANPRRGLWGGPPAETLRMPVRPALDLVSRAGAAVELANIVRTAVPELGLTGRRPVAPRSADTQPSRSQPKRATVLGSTALAVALAALFAHKLAKKR
jgi:hypothetical protein